MKIGKPYIRKKKDGFVIEVKVDARTIFLKTLPSAEVLIELLTLEASNSYIEKKINIALEASSESRRLEEFEEESEMSS